MVMSQSIWNADRSWTCGLRNKLCIAVSFWILVLPKGNEPLWEWRAAVMPRLLVSGSATLCSMCKVHVIRSETNFLCCRTASLRKFRQWKAPAYFPGMSWEISVKIRRRGLANRWKPTVCLGFFFFFGKPVEFKLADEIQRPRCIWQAWISIILQACLKRRDDGN